MEMDEAKHLVSLSHSLHSYVIVTMKLLPFRNRIIWSRRIHLVVVLACLTVIMVTGMAMLTSPIAGYREKVQALVAMDFNDGSGSENYQEVINSDQETADQVYRSLDISYESKWIEGYNNYSDMAPIKDDSLSRPYSYLYKQQNDDVLSSFSSYCDDRYGFDVIRNWRENIQPLCDEACPATNSNDDHPCIALGESNSTDVGIIYSRNSPEISKFSMECSMMHMDIPENLCHTKNLILNLDRIPQEPKRGTIDMFLVPGSTEAKCKLKNNFYDQSSWGFGGTKIFSFHLQVWFF
jgi:hypothetical protein